MKWLINRPNDCDWINISDNGVRGLISYCNLNLSYVELYYSVRFSTEIGNHPEIHQPFLMRNKSILTVFSSLMNLTHILFLLSPLGSHLFLSHYRLVLISEGYDPADELRTWRKIGKYVHTVRSDILVFRTRTESKQPCPITGP